MSEVLTAHSPCLEPLRVELSLYGFKNTRFCIRGCCVRAFIYLSIYKAVPFQFQSCSPTLYRRGSRSRSPVLALQLNTVSHVLSQRSQSSLNVQGLQGPALVQLIFFKLTVSLSNTANSFLFFRYLFLAFSRVLQFQLVGVSPGPRVAARPRLPRSAGASRATKSSGE